MKILLVNPRMNMRYPQPPLGLLSVGTVLQDLGHTVKLCDMNASRNNHEQLVHLADEADIIGLTATSLSYRKVAELGAFLHGFYPQKDIVLGGVQASIMPEQILTLNVFDTVVAGEGDDKEVLQYIVDKRALHTIYRSEAKVNLDNLPILNYYLLDGYEYRAMPPHGMHGPVMPVMTSRGCPYQCTFCSKAVFGNTYRSQSPERIIAEVNHLRLKGYKEIAFYDDIFTINRKQAIRLMELLAPLDMHWTCQTRVNLVDYTLLKAMKEAGCVAIAYGLESGVPDVLKELCKDATVEQAEVAIQLTKKAGIKVIGYFMLGSPTETLETLEQTIKWSTKLNIDYAQYSITMPLPGSALYEQREFSKYAMGVLGNGLCDLDGAELNKAVSDAYKGFYFRPSYILRQVKQSLHSWTELKSNFNGAKLLLKGV